MEKLKKESNFKKNWLFITGSLIFMLGLGIVLYDTLSKKYINDIEEKSLIIFEKIEKEDTERIESKPSNVVKEKNYIEYIASIEIPKINLERGLVSQDSYLNNIEYNVEILDSSNSPDEENGNVILAAHSGNSRVSYFKNLDKLTLNDEIILKYHKKIYIYHVKNIYDIEKTGKAKIIRNPKVKSLTLITCRSNTNKQIVIVSELVKEVNINE